MTPTCGPSPSQGERTGLDPRRDRRAVRPPVHRPPLPRRRQSTARHHAPNEVQLSTLLSIKTGGCPEDCGYCCQSAHAETGLKADEADGRRRRARRRRRGEGSGSRRFCMGAAWRKPKDRDMDALCAMVAGVKAMGLETCMTLGMLTPDQAERLAEAGLDYYNHNLDTSPEHYGDGHHHPDLSGAARHAGACPRRGHGGLLRRHRRHGRDARGPGRLPPRARHAARAIPKACRSTRWCRSRARCSATCSPTRRWRKIDDIEFVRTVAVARITMPMSMVRLSAGRESMSESDAGALLPRRRELDLHRRQAADHRQCRRRRGRGVVREAGPGGRWSGESSRRCGWPAE